MRPNYRIEYRHADGSWQPCIQDDEPRTSRVFRVLNPDGVKLAETGSHAEALAIVHRLRRMRTAVA